MKKRINVTKTYMPDLASYNTQLARIWSSGWITNKGKLHSELEQELKSHLKVDDISLTCNGTLPLQAALKVLPKNTEVITTPFSYIATTAAIVWEGYTPCFVDIDPLHLTIDENKIEAAITPNTSAILATHVFGNPCNVDKINEIAKRHKLLVIYDAAHCFDVKYNGSSIFNFGDISTCSFHATKLFHTGEGGAFFCKETEHRMKLEQSCNFGHDGLYGYHGLGINGKMSELHAAMGLSVLPHMNDILEERKRVVEYYLANLPLEKVQTLKIRSNTEWNYSYFPVIFQTEKALLTCIALLNEKSIFPRRYFYPSLNQVPYVKAASMPISESIANKILCLPLFFEIDRTTLDEICLAVKIATAVAQI